MAADCPVATGLPPLDTTGVLWVAAIDLLPIKERIAWVAKVEKQVEEINEERARHVALAPGWFLWDFQRSHVVGGPYATLGEAGRVRAEIEGDRNLWITNAVSINQWMAELRG